MGDSPCTLGRIIPVMERAIRLSLLLTALCALVYGIPQATDTSESEQDKDTYAIYALVLTHPRTSHGSDDNERYLIAETTETTFPQEPCVQPPTEREADFQEVMTDYQQRKSTPRKLKPEFSIVKPYFLLDASAVTKFMQEREGTLPSHGEAVNSKEFQGVSDIFTLSDVYFNQRRTLAMTAIRSWCGGLCGRQQWKVFEKLDKGGWEERRWITCSGMSNTFWDGRLPSLQRRPAG
jgi:hypothetical protein